MAPIMTLFYLDHVGLSFKDFTFFETTIFILITILEIPSGAISDLIGRKKAVIFSDLLIITGMGILVFTPSLLTVICAALLFSIGVSLGSGNLQAITYDILKKENLEEEYLKISSKCSGISMVMTIIASFIGGHLADINICIPVLVDIACIMISSILILVLLRTDSTKGSQKLNLNVIKDGYRTIVDSINEVKYNLKLLSTIGLGALIFGYTRASYMTYQPLLSELSFLKSEIGMLFSAFGVISAIFSFLNPKINALFRRRGKMEYVFIVLVAVCIAFTSFESIHFIFGAMFVHQIIRGMTPSFFSNAINKLIQEDNNRVTVISIANFMNSLICATLILFIGFFADLTSFRMALLAISILIAVTAIALSLVAKSKEHGGGDVGSVAKNT